MILDRNLSCFFSKILQMIAIQRKDNNMWAMPGGMLDDNETPFEAAKREFSEEALHGASGKTALHLLRDALIGVFEMIYFQRKMCPPFPNSLIRTPTKSMPDTLMTREIRTTHGWRPQHFIFMMRPATM